VKVGAVDLGGTHVEGAVVDLGWNRLDERTRVPVTDDATRDDLLTAIAAAARAASPPGVEHLGVATPGPFDYARGISMITGLGKLEPLYGADLREAIGVATRVTSIAFLNDAAAFGLGEARVGAARGLRRAIAITLGSGLGSTFLRDGAPVHEGEGVPPNGVLYPLHLGGVPVEDRISRRALIARYDERCVDVDVIAARAFSGEPQASALFAELGEDLADFLAPWVAAFAAERVVVGGAIARAWPLFAAPLERLGRGVAVPARRPDDAALVGAAAYAVS
jgi:glucokinase